MCGIVGIFCKNKASVEAFREGVNASLDVIRHRGPDDRGILVHNNIILGHVRLSIIDLTRDGHQPMISSDNRYVITYNGEVYNYKDLKQEISHKDINYRSNTDTEVILEYFKLHGVAMFSKLNGMFAFSVIDKKNQKAYLVRDRFGIKPLYYYKDKNKIIFASEIKAIQAIVDNKEINEKALHEWSYYGNTLREETLFKNIKQLLPGCYLEIDTDTLEFKQETYWQPESLLNHYANDSKHDSKKNIKNVRFLLEEAVCKQLVGDVPVGVFLSGGVDSSAITAFAASNYNKQINTYSVGFDFEQGVGELPKAALIAKKFNTNHHELRVTGYDLADTVEKMVHYHDSPFSDAANIPLFLLGEKVKDKVKVVLQGDGGDEIFAGYKRYQTLSTRQFWKPFIGTMSKLHRHLPHSKKFYLRQRYLNALSSYDEAELMALLLTVEDKNNNPIQIFSQEIQDRISSIDPFKSYRECNNRFINEDMTQRMLFTDTQLILPSTFLEKVDRATMAASIEVRVPFLDNTLTEYVMSLPSALKIKHGQKKWLLKQAMRGILPDDILFSKKSGFNVPYQQWLKGPLNQLFNDKILELQGNGCTILDWKYVARLVRENKEGQRNNSFMLWKVLNLMIWLSNND